MDAELAALVDEQFVSLTTYRRNGDPVPTPVWCARDGDALVVTTNDGTGKVRRIAADPAVSLQPCDRRGRVRPGSPVVTGHAEVVRDAGAMAPAMAALAASYGLVFTAITAAERYLFRNRGARVVLRIT